ncbi:MAG: aminotransferase class I/II-fold pyridoxal phosphate-dependent enzyme [Candidatus Thorarchaeota archaeon]|nr:aminotransferase class I/II-fold pyridoxal phosphate-dependent enzyme [Candidatus Thorarchaeota archaeon]MCK5239693.1 aminotransferase class I/II-fold pyridoxal phosphate-dependent enzyme [Candidatus Thorarchaeota archaeon]
MKFEPFELERIQSKWEHVVEINLTESGVSPITLGELIDDPRSRPFLFERSLGYSQTNGTEKLRDLISSDYAGTTRDNVLVTNGGAEANFVAAWYLLHESGTRDELVVLLPNYMQLYGIWKNLGGRVKSFHLKMQGGEWVPDMEELKDAVSERTAAVAICTPNNPTGAILDESQLKEIADITYDMNAWLLSDEIYRGVELEGPKAPSAFDYSEKVMITSSLSKAYGLPGLRLGWIATSSPETAQDIWAYTDYTTICPSTLSDHLATIALGPDVRERLEKRARERVGAHWHIMKEWLDDHHDILDYVPPKAASMCFPRYDLDIKSLDLVEKLRIEKDVLVVPGSHFGMEYYLRIGFGYEEAKLREGLRRISELMRIIS